MGWEDLEVEHAVSWVGGKIEIRNAERRSIIS